MPRQVLGAIGDDEELASASTASTTAATEPAADLLPFAVGQEVMANWPGGTQWYKARILNNVGSYKVEFDNDKSKHTLDAHSVTAITPSANKKRQGRPSSPSRKSRNPSASPGRSRQRKPSPARIRTPSKSPSRRPAKAAGATTPPRKRLASGSRSAIPTGASTAEVASTSRKGPAKASRSTKMSVAVLPSIAVSDFMVDEADLSPIVPTQQPYVDSSPGGLRQREFGRTRMSARVAAVQTARVAGVVTPGLIAESIADNQNYASIPAKPARRSRYHFYGPSGAFVLTFLLPPLILATYGFCNKDHCTLKKFVVPRRVSDYLDFHAVAIFFGWMAFQAILYLLPIGRLVEGQPLRDGTRLKYRMNGPLAFILSLGLVAGALYYDATYADLLLDKLLPIAITSILFSYVLSLILYLQSRRVAAYDLSPLVASNQPNFFYDFFMGRELNPRPLGFELKMFLELRPGVIGWAALNLVILWKDWVSNDGQVSPALVISAAIQMLYVIDALVFEAALMTTFDVTTEALGFMLVFGDLFFVPAVFTMPSRFLLIERSIVPVLSWYCVVAIIVMAVFGYVIFRSSNIQKDQFRCNPFASSVSHLETIPTSYVKKILAGGWWGWVRHPNYFGDFLIALAISLPSGFVSPIPYAYCAYMFPMLIHRACRDEDLCHQKYGAAWDEYRARVRYRIVKYVF